jgi:hydrogenase maturation protease
MTALIAGFGNIFCSDDGLGCCVARLLSNVDVGPGVRVRDFGTSGMQLALEMLDGYDLVVVVDAIQRDAAPGTVFAIECDEEAVYAERPPDAHAMTIDAVLALYKRLYAQTEATHAPRIVVVGCVPKNLEDGMDLSEPVRAALPVCVDLVRRITNEYLAAGAQT